MQQRHKNRQQYFNEQVESSKKYILTYIHDNFPIREAHRVLEIGCGEAGNLHPFLELGCECYGVELLEVNYNNAQAFYSDNPLREHLHLFNKNIYDVESEDLGGLFDIVFLRDVIEHIPHQEMFMKHVKKFLAPDGVVFFAFPPWRNPFGGHQQICHNKWFCRMPYLHLLPKKWYAALLKMGGETQGTINGLLEIMNTRMSINYFNKMINTENFIVVNKTYYFINPNYEIKFGLPPRKVWKIFQIPFLQDFYTTAVYFLLKKE